MWIIFLLSLFRMTLTGHGNEMVRQGITATVLLRKDINFVKHRFSSMLQYPHCTSGHKNALAALRLKQFSMGFLAVMCPVGSLDSTHFLRSVMPKNSYCFSINILRLSRFLIINTVLEWS